MILGPIEKQYFDILYGKKTYIYEIYMLLLCGYEIKKQVNVPLDKKEPGQYRICTIYNFVKTGRINLDKVTQLLMLAKTDPINCPREYIKQVEIAMFNSLGKDKFSINKRHKVDY